MLRHMASVSHVNALGWIGSGSRVGGELMSERKRAARGVGRFWVAAAAVGGALAAFLADPVRGKARRQAAVERTRTALNVMSDQTQQWQRAITSRLSRGAPKMTALTTESSEPATSEATEPPPAPQPTRSKSATKPPDS